ncbi:hypothetical protein CC80DRAFT_489995 [Byssothecium circinans]|uniref:Uncharacterized protein n=1 Tax=Byssothecium circinans TaxID=147558 RepID=A0A6A5U5K2_9PLEO|nr:hypothetical protein CC80DRAFT_489995 [Byssothecium circinans]
MCGMLGDSGAGRGREKGRTRLMRDRFHAWQSSLLFAFIFVVHVIFSWSSIISWFLFVGDLALIGYLTMRAYRDGKAISCVVRLGLIYDIAETLDRFEVPFFGPLANSILGDE